MTAIEMVAPLPKWATDEGDSIPLGFLPAIDRNPDKFWLGDYPQKAVVLLDQSWRDAPAEDWVGVAAGAYHAICHVECSREMAELIAKGWIAAAALHAAKVREYASRIIIPASHTQH